MSLLGSMARRASSGVPGAKAALSGLLLAASAAALPGCNTEAFCFANCETGSVSTGNGGGSSGSSGTTGTGGEGGSIITGTGAGGGCLVGCETGGTGGCMTSNGGIEKCDGLDNDCNGKVDDLPDLDLGSPATCGTCSNNCYAVPGSNWAPATVTCTPPAGAGPGTCSGACAQDYWDLNGDGKCDYYCIQTDPGGDALCNNKDDDCDGKVDEDVDLCADVNNCGACGKKCLGPNATFACVQTGGGACDALSTKCQLTGCACAPGACFWDADGSAANGCEYLCEQSNGGVEICDGKDNDCNGKTDDGIPAAPCFGAPLGVCAAPAHAGTTVCVSAKIECSGPDVLLKGALPELCNGEDDDCDGLVDNDAMGAGVACGASNLFPCTFGVKQCLGGVLACVGSIDPQPETCNGQDDDCNGQIDDGAPDAIGDCNVPLPPPPGAISACVKGSKACSGGALLCVGSVGPAPGAQDTCGVDQNCDGLLTNQPNTMTDVHNCGACGNDCLAGALHAGWSCAAGACAFQGCQPGYYDLDGNNTCEYACAFVSAQEACNGQDDNCNGQIDEGVVAPSPVAVCGVSPSASSPECTTGVTVACMNGGWHCTFPAGGATTCPTATEVCDGLDNNCNGSINENVAGYGKVRASDDGVPPPGHGVCRTLGTVVCNGPNASKCSAVKADCATLPGGCTELCDGLDNDCDGLIDEPFTSKGPNAANWVEPAVVKLGAGATGPWIFAYEASRPNATGVSQGSGNGYHVVAPAGVTFDKTFACSKPGVLPWANVSPREVEQTCAAIGGRVCDLSEWKRTCRVNNNDAAGPNSPDVDNGCKWGYGPLGAACKSPGDYQGATKNCNLGAFDFDPVTPNDQDGLLVTASPLLHHCASVWDGYNGVAAQAAYDIAGNLHELTRCQDDRAVCGADAGKCTRSCCSGTSTVAGATRLCGTLADARRLSGQSCAAAADCCNLDTSCTANGTCKADVTGALYCTNTPAPATSCRAAGVACTGAAQCCGGEPCTGGFCGGPSMVPRAVYPLMGGSFVTGFENGASCDFDFYKVSQTFKLYDSGFRCCFDAQPD